MSIKDKLRLLFKRNKKEKAQEVPVKVEPEVKTVDPDAPIVPVKAELEPSRKICSLKQFAGFVEVVRGNSKPGQTNIKIRRDEVHVLFISNGVKNPPTISGAYVTAHDGKFHLPGWNYDAEFRLSSPIKSSPQIDENRIVSVINDVYNVFVQPRQIIYKPSNEYDWDVYTMCSTKITMSDGSVNRYFYSIERLAKEAVDKINAKIG